jgi:hypothetical protein
MGSQVVVIVTGLQEDVERMNQNHQNQKMMRKKKSLGLGLRRIQILDRRVRLNLSLQNQRMKRRKGDAVVIVSVVSVRNNVSARRGEKENVVRGVRSARTRRMTVLR